MVRGEIGSSARNLRAAFAGMLTLAALGLLATPASADHHFMKIREVYPGHGAGGDQEYVELQMTAAGQNNVTGQTVRLYFEDGAERDTCTFSSNPPNGENQRTILVGTQAAQSAFGTTMDCLVTPSTSNLTAVGGAVCFTSTVFGTIDCVSWGTFSTFNDVPPGCTNAPPPSCTGPPEGFIPDGSSLTRSIEPNCPSLLEDADDTNNSANDFTPTAPSPRNNAATPTEAPCAGDGGGGAGPDTTIDKKPKDKVKKKRVTYGFSSPTPGVSFQCSENGDPFEGCTSPHKFKAEKGKNEFEVRAVDAAGNVDQSPAEDRFKFKKPK